MATSLIPMKTEGAAQFSEKVQRWAAARTGHRWQHHLCPPSPRGLGLRSPLAHVRAGAPVTLVHLTQSTPSAVHWTLFICPDRLPWQWNTSSGLSAASDGSDADASSVCAGSPPHCPAAVPCGLAPDTSNCSRCSLPRNPSSVNQQARPRVTPRSTAQLTMSCWATCLSPHSDLMPQIRIKPGILLLRPDPPLVFLSGSQLWSPFSLKPPYWTHSLNPSNFLPIHLPNLSISHHLPGHCFSPGLLK